MPTPAQSRAAAAHKAKRQEAGEKQITVWLSADALERLNNLTQFMGTRQMALQWAINRVTCSPDEVAERRALFEPTPSKPVTEPGNRLITPADAAKILANQVSAFKPGYRPVADDVEALADNPGMPIRIERIPKASAFKPHPKPTKGKR